MAFYFLKYFIHHMILYLHLEHRQDNNFDDQYDGIASFSSDHYNFQLVHDIQFLSNSIGDLS